jgi:hypothetical protein
MRASYIALLLSGLCATPAVAEPAEGTDVGISLSHGIVDSRAALLVAITNRSRNPICIHTDALRNPASGEMYIGLRDSRGRALRHRGAGFIDPPMAGAVRVEPGETVQAHNFVDWKFGLAHDGIPFPEGMSAQVSLHYGYCDDVWSLQATSTWQPI